MSAPAALTIADLVKRRAWREPRETPWVALAVWVVGTFAFFTLAPFKLPHYGLPAYPALALLAARWWEERLSARIVPVLHLAAFTVIALGLAWVYWGDLRAFMGWIFGATDVYTRKEIAVGQSSPLPPWEDLKRFIGETALIFALGGIGLLAAIKRKARPPGVFVILVTLLAWMPVVGGALSLVSSSRSVRQIVREVTRRAAPADLLIHEGPIENSGALEFYSGARPVILDGRVSGSASARRFQKPRAHFGIVRSWPKCGLASGGFSFSRFGRPRTAS